MSHFLRLFACLIALGLAMPLSVRAQNGERCLLMPTDIRSLPKTRRPIAESLVAAVLASSGTQLVPLDEAISQESPSKVKKTKQCRRPKCAAQQAAAFGVKTSILISVRRSSRAFTVQLQSVDAQKQVATLTENIRLLVLEDPENPALLAPAAAKILANCARSKSGPAGCQIISEEGGWVLDEGVCQAGLASGFGKGRSEAGTTYVGDFLSGKFHGQGEYTGPDGAKYVGEFREGKCSGKAVQTWPSGDRYEGMFLDNNFDGQGVFLWQNGTKYEGEYKGGKRHGLGSLSWPIGVTQSGRWQNDDFIGPEEGFPPVQPLPPETSVPNESENMNQNSASQPNKGLK